jgi:hypothetical protein
MSFGNAADCKPEAAPAPDRPRDNSINQPLVFAAAPLSDAVLIEAIWSAAHASQSRRLIAAIRERKD